MQMPHWVRRKAAQINAAAEMNPPFLPHDIIKRMKVLSSRIRTHRYPWDWTNAQCRYFNALTPLLGQLFDGKRKLEPTKVDDIHFHLRTLLTKLEKHSV